MCVRNIYKQVIIYTLGVIMNRKLLGILFILIISVSACPGSSVDFNQNAGAVLQDLTFDFPKIYDDEDVTLLFDVVNVGGKEITKGGVNVYVYGPTIESGDATWTLLPALSNPSSISSANGYITTTVSSIDLPPPDPSLGLPGGRQSFELTFDPAQVLDGVEVPTKFYASLCYPYTTETMTQVEVTSKNELRATGIRSSRKDTINAAGPIHLSVQGDGNIRAGGVIPLVFKVNDVGGGFATLNNCGVDLASNVRNRVKVTVTVDGNTATCSPDNGEVRIKNGVGTLFCTYKSDASSAPRRTYMVKATAEYKYYVTSTATVTNIGSSLDGDTSEDSDAES